MSLEVVIDSIKSQASNVAPFGASLKFVIDEQVLHIDGTGEENLVSSEDKEAQCTITMSSETMSKLKSGDLNPMMAVMSGKVKIKGDMGLAMKLQSLL